MKDMSWLVQSIFTLVSAIIGGGIGAAIDASSGITEGIGDVREKINSYNANLKGVPDIPKNIDDLKAKITNLDYKVSKWLEDLYLYYADAHFKRYLSEESCIIKDKHAGVIKSVSTDLDTYRAIALDFIDNAKEKLYATCIFPPSFWIAGIVLFSWNEIDGDKFNKFAREHLKEKFGVTLTGEIQKEYSNNNMTIKISDINYSISLHLDAEGKKAILKINGNEKYKYVVMGEKPNLKVYSGDCTAIDSYKEYFEKFRNKKLEKKRILITDVMATEDKWHQDDEDMVKQFITEYNNGVDVQVAKLNKISPAYYGDLIIVDEITALIYDPHITEPNGEKNGRLQVITGNVVKDNYANLFTSPDHRKKLVKPEKFWEYLSKKPQ